MLVLEEHEQPTLEGENLVLFTGNSNPQLATAIAEYLDVLGIGSALER